MSKEFEVSGIYCLENKINGKKYIGQSINIWARFLAHKYESNNPKLAAYNFNISRAIRKYGLENFTLTTLENCENLSEREIFYIQKYNTFIDGYNMTIGGGRPPILKGEENGRAKLTEEDVIFIRIKLLEGYQFREVYPKFQERISERGMKHIWWGTSWKYIMPEIYFNREKLFANCKKGSKPYRTITELEYMDIIKAKNNKLDRISYWKENYSDKVSLSTFNNYWYEYRDRIKLL